MMFEGEIPENLFVEQGKAIEGVLRRAVHHALIAHKRAGNPVASWKDGRVVLLSSEEIPVEELSESEQSDKDMQPTR